ncbi:hypothetical protein ES703_102851 [subsurface metagenome]
MMDHLSLIGQPARMSIIYDTFSTDSIGGSFYAADREICRILNTYGGIPIKSEPSGGGIENVELTSEGRAILGITQSDVAHHAFNGEAPFFEPHRQIRAICWAHHLNLWIAVLTSSSIYSLTDLRGKRIAMGALGGESSIITKALLDAYKYQEGDYRPFYLSISNAVQGIRNSEIDVIFYLSGGPGSALEQLSQDFDLRLLMVDNLHAERILKTHPYWKKSLINKDSWPGLDRDIPTLGISCLLITHRDVPIKMIYSITSAIMENADEINFVYSDGTRYGIETALRGITIPLHSGAAEYYRERGLIHD